MKMPTLMTPKNAVSASNMATDPVAPQPDLTARGVTQSKGFRWGSNFANAMMISGNTLCRICAASENKSWQAMLHPCCGQALLVQALLVQALLVQALLGQALLVEGLAVAGGGAGRLGNRRSLDLNQPFSLPPM